MSSALARNASNPISTFGRKQTSANSHAIDGVWPIQNYLGGHVTTLGLEEILSFLQIRRKNPERQ